MRCLPDWTRMWSISLRTPSRSILQCPLAVSVLAFSPAIELVVEADSSEQDFDFTVLARAHPQARLVVLSETGLGAAGARLGMKKLLTRIGSRSPSRARS